jgi:thiamine-phosphate pyrophosphorylase
VKIPRVYPILDTAALERRGLEDWSEVAEAWVAAGAEILQIRHKSYWSRTHVEQAAALNQIPLGIPLIINDRADIAARLGAGLHVGQDDLTPSDCRRVIGSQCTLGFSTHNPEQLQTAADEPVDYVAFGPVFPTQSKQRPDPLVGLAGLRAARLLTRKPLVAIGGITLENCRQAFDAGADSVAVIAGLLPEALTLPSLKERMEQWQQSTRQ